MWRKPQVVIGLCLALACLAVPVAAAAPRDVPPSHPAYLAIQKLIDQGYLSVFQDGSFQGDRPVDRYTLAAVIARLLSDIQSGKVVLPNEEMKTLRQLATEFRAELVEVAGKVNDVAQKQEKAEREMTVARDDLTALHGGLYEQQQALESLQGKVQGLERETARQAQLLAELQKRSADSETLGGVQKTVNEVLVPQVESVVAAQRSLESSLQDLRAEFESYRKASDAEVAALKTQTRNQLIGGAVVALLLYLFR
ncbi:MAG TPA: hypothetical protein GXX28_08775 [Firmicutes bacterium]|nr:hypothetical protein [Bacillota bacterium]